MAGIVLAVDFEIEARLLPGIVESGHEVLDRVAGAEGVIDAIERLRADLVVLSASPDTLSRASLSACERAGCRIVAVAASELDVRTARALGLLETVDAEASWPEIEAALRGERSASAPWTVEPGAEAEAAARADRRPEGAPAVWRPGEGGPGSSAPDPEGRRARGERRRDRRRAEGAGGRRLGFGRARRGKVGAAEAPEFRGPAIGVALAAPGAATASAHAAGAAPTPQLGRVVPVWGPHGSPGATTIAIGLAAEAAARGLRVILVDADTYGGAIGPMLGLGDEAPGFAAACRLAGADSLTPAELDRVAAHTGADGSRFRVLTGIPNPARWPELSRERVLATLRRCRELADLVVVDVGFALEADDEIASDALGPRRNAAALATLELAYRIVAVSGADALSLQRFLRARLELLELAGAAPVDVVVNRVRSAAVGMGAAGQVRAVLARFGGIDDPVLVPHDQSAADRAHASALPLGQASPRSAAAKAIAELADRHCPRRSARRLAGERRKAERRRDRERISGASGPTAAPPSVAPGVADGPGGDGGWPWRTGSASPAAG